MSALDDRALMIISKLGDADPDVRRSGMDFICALGEAARPTVPYIVRFFQQFDRNIRRDAIKAIGRLGRLGLAAAPALVARLGDEDAGVRRMARIAVLDVDPDGEILLTALKHSDPRIRKSATDALPRLIKMNPPPLNALVGHLADDDADARAKILATLVSIGPAAVSLLIDALRSERTTKVALEALGKFEQASAPAIRPLLELTRANPKVVKDVVGVLGAIGSAAVPALAGLLDDESLDAPFLRRTDFDDLFRSFYGFDFPRTDTVSRGVCNALARTGALPELIHALKHRRLHVRESAALALAEMGPEAKSALQALIENLNDPGEIRRPAAEAIASIFPKIEARVDALIAALRDSSGRIDPGNVWPLVVGADAVPILLERIRSNDPTTRQLAIQALSSLLSTLRILRISPRPDHPSYTVDYRTITSGELSRLARDDPDVFEQLSHYHSPDQFKYISGPTRRGPGRLRELTLLVEARQELLAKAEKELALAVAAENQVVSLSPEIAPAVDNAVRTQREPRRYTDLAIYEGHLFPSDLPAAIKLSDKIPLVAASPYTLEVAIRRKRTGIDSARDAPRSVDNPRSDQEDLPVYVIVRPFWDGIEVKDPFGKITWPYNKDSDVALFRITAKDLGRKAQTEIEVRLYDQSLDLLDIVRVFVTIVPASEREAKPYGIPPRHLSWPDKRPGILMVDPKSPARLLSVNVSSLENRYRFEFLFRGRDTEDVKIQMVRSISKEDLDKLLLKVRDFWTKLVVSTYSQTLHVTSSTYQAYISRLAEIGMDAWSLLFGSRYADQAGASERLAEFLGTIERRDGALLQITYTEGSTGFVFPWSILYRPAADSETADPLRFWGAQYQIEQVTAGPKSDELSDEPVGVLFALDPSFGNSDAQNRLMQKYNASTRGKICVTGPISDQDSLFAELARRPPAHLLYFYCHGFASNMVGLLRPDGVQLLKQRIEEVPEGSPNRQALETLLSLTSLMGDESWIFIGGSEITEGKLKRQRFFESRRPVVFLNMCQSADLMPSMSSGLVRVFLDHNASAVIGTESPMTAVFADAFGQAVLDSMFAGDTVGMALWKARRKFLSEEMRNPLGLAYTLYGRATGRLGNPPALVKPDA